MRDYTVVGTPTADYPTSTVALCEEDYVTSNTYNDIRYTTTCQADGQFSPKISCIARDYDSPFQKLHDGSQYPIVDGDLLEPTTTGTWDNCVARALLWEASLVIFAPSDGRCFLLNFGLPENLQITSNVRFQVGTGGWADVYARGDVNIAYGKHAIGTVGDQTLIGSIVDGIYDSVTCYMITNPVLPWIKVDLGHWYRVARVQLTMGIVLGAATVTIKAIGDPAFVVSDAAPITGHTNCATNVAVTMEATRIFTCTSAAGTYVTSRVIALYVAAAASASVCELAVYTDQDNLNLALRENIYDVDYAKSSEYTKLIDGTRSNRAQFASCTPVPADINSRPAVHVTYSSTESFTLFKVAITTHASSTQTTFAVYADDDTKCYDDLEIPAGQRGFQYCRWPMLTYWVTIEGTAPGVDMVLCEIEIYEWDETATDTYGLELWQADCPRMTPDTTDSDASDLEECADSCHDSDTCRGIIYRTNTCYHLSQSETLCYYRKSDATVIIGYKIARCDAITYINAQPLPAQYYGDYGEVICNEGFSLDEDNHTDTTSDGLCTAEQSNDFFGLDLRECEAVQCTYDATQPPNINENSIVGETRHYTETIDVSCMSGYVQRPSNANNETVYPATYSINCAANGTFDSPETCKGRLCDIKTPDTIQEADANGIYLDEITLHCQSGYRIPTNNTIEEYSTQCMESGNWSMLVECQRVRCPALFPQHTQNEVNGSYEDERTAECIEGYITTLEGPDYITADNYTSATVIRSYTSRCEASGEWSLNSACRRTFCKAPAFDNTTQQDVPGTDFVGEYEDTKQLDCKIGYWTKKGHLRNYDITCGPNGVWLTNNSCVNIECAGLVIDNAEVSPFKAWALYEESVQVTCGDNYETADALREYHTQCTSSGNWTFSKKCLLMECDPITLLNTNATNHTQAAGSSVLVTCAVGHETEFGASSFHISCNPHRLWRNAYNCSRIYCQKLNVPHTNTWDVYKQYGDTWEIVSLPGHENQFSNSTMTCVCGADKQWTPQPIITPVRCLAEAPQLTTTSELDSVYPKSTLVKCQDGCSLNGSFATNYLSQCNASAMWSKLIPCEQIWCPEYHIDGWSQGLPRAMWGTHVVQECNAGFETSDGMREASCSCGNGGLWTYKKCFKAKCPAFIAVNVAQSNTPGIFGDTLYIKCPEGHQSAAGITEYSTTCGANKAWSQMHSCWPRNCSAYSVPNTTVENMVGIFGQVKTGVCIAGHAITSIQSTFTLRCNSSGQWEHPLTVCNPVTCEPFLVPYSQGVSNSLVSGYFGDSMEVRCSVGYSLSYSEEQVTTYCNISGNWNWTGSCNPITCQPLIHDHSVEPSRALGNITYGTVYEFRCTDGYSDMSLMGSNGTKCLTNGQWSPAPSCLPLCPALSAIPYGKVSPKKVMVNTQCTYTCNRGFQLVGNSIRKCVYFPLLRMSLWTGTIPECKVTPINGFWYPWSEWTFCTFTCNHGMHARERRCEPPLYGGTSCVGLERQLEVCNEVPCPVDSIIEEWTKWTNCNATCGLEYQTRARHCVPALHGGMPCNEHKDENNDKKKTMLTAVRNCDIPYCPASQYEAVTQAELQGQFKLADEDPMVRYVSIFIGVLFTGLVIGMAVGLDIASVLMKRHDRLLKTNDAGEGSNAEGCSGEGCNEEGSHTPHTTSEQSSNL